MIECALAWIMLLLGIVKKEPFYFIASGVYAAASHLSFIREGK